MRSHLSLYHRDEDGTWFCDVWRSDSGRRHLRICEAILRSAGLETRIKKETFCEEADR